MDAQGILNNIKAVKSQDKDQYLMDASKGTITSTVIGGGLGLLIAYNRKFNLILGAVIGGSLAGIASNYFINKK
jgi:hypothetical protein